MGRKNPQLKKSKPEKKVILIKDVGTTDIMINSNIKVIGNCRYIENYLGVRINTPDRKSFYYSILASDVEACFNEPLSVAYVYNQPDRMKDEKVKAGSCRCSKTQRSLNILLDDGQRFFISKRDIEKCFKDIIATGNILQFIE